MTDAHNGGLDLCPCGYLGSGVGLFFVGGISQNEMTRRRKTTRWGYLGLESVWVPGTTEGALARMPETDEHLGVRNGRRSTPRVHPKL
jgi:hypothetical protein